MAEPMPPSEPERFSAAELLLLEEMQHHPHDAFFKACFGKPEVARKLFQEHLPADIAGPIDWATLKLHPTSFVKRTLEQSHADLVFGVRSGDQEILIYLLLEHQTTTHPLMPLRMLGYLTEMWFAHTDQSKPSLPLPAIIPFVIHQGPARWNVPTEFCDLVAVPTSLGSSLVPFLPKFRYALLDLTQFDPLTHEADETLRVTFRLMQMVRTKEQLMEYFEWMAATVASLPDELLRLLLLYSLYGDAGLDVQAIYGKLSANPKLAATTMSTALKLIAEGRLEGELKGKLEGKLEGKIEGKLEGKLEGELRGTWVGKIELLEQLIPLPPTADAALKQMPLEELQAKFKVLEQTYADRHKP